MLTRFNGNVVPFADDATSTNRTVFGGTTQSDTLDDNLNADFKKGWEIVGLNDNPTREDFNAMGYTLGALNAYLYEMGIAEWNASQNYRIGSRVVGSNGKLYKAITGTTGTPNVNHNPISDTTNWIKDSLEDFITSLASNGYQKLPSGLIIQWGTVTATGGTGTILTFPMSFPTSCISLTLLDAGNGCYQYGTNNFGSSSASIYCKNNGTFVTGTAYWFAIGY